MNKHQNSISLKKGLENDQFSYLGPPNEKINFKVVFDVHSYCFWTSPLSIFYEVLERGLLPNNP